jgi:flagellar motor switch protein FliN
MDENEIAVDAFPQEMPAGFPAMEDSGTETEASHGLEAGIPEVSDDHDNEPLLGTATGVATMPLPSGTFLQIPITVQVILGSARMPLSKVMALAPGSILTLDKKLSEPVILMANGNQIAKGLVVVLDDETGQLGISLTEIIAELSDKKLSA